MTALEELAARVAALEQLISNLEISVEQREMVAAALYEAGRADARRELGVPARSAGTGAPIGAPAKRNHLRLALAGCGSWPWTSVYIGHVGPWGTTAP